MNQHPQRDILRAIGDGQPVEYRYKGSRDGPRPWRDHNSECDADPTKIDASIQWRIKPELVVHDCVVKLSKLSLLGICFCSPDVACQPANVRFTTDDTGVIGVELIK